MIRFVFLCFVGVMLSGGAASAAGACYENETNPKTRHRYETEVQYQEDLKAWNAQPRDSVGPIDLVLAYAEYRNERERASKLGPDKVEHCYLGCVIALKTSAKVANYLGWLKEYRDLTDCDPGTHFEAADAIATAKGAFLGAQTRKECATLCRSEFHPALRKP